MIKAMLSDGREVRVLFKHRRFTPAETPGDQCIHFRRNGHVAFISAISECHIVSGPRGEEQLVVPVGLARQSERDPFCYETARETALFHALGYDKKKPMVKQTTLLLLREDTGAVLAAYFTRPRPSHGKKSESAAGAGSTRGAVDSGGTESHAG